jgi:ABC-type uncharacterized transport system involved in gliding motility auxiliary subunit
MANQPNTSWIKTRQSKFALYAVVYTLIIVGIVGGVNFLANRYNKSVDTTSAKKFTLSEQSIKIAKNLKNDVTITYWDAANKFTGAHDLLDRYKNLSPKIDVQYQDVDKKKTAAMAAGVKAYGTIFVKVGEKQQEAKSLTEEEITGALVRAMKGGERMACFTLGSGEHSIDDTERDGYSAIKGQLEKNNYKTETLKMAMKAEIPATCTVVVVGGPQRDYLQPEVDAIKNFVENGGRALIMIDPPLKLQKMETDENPALAAMLGAWGVTPAKNLVLDLSGMGQQAGLGPEYPLVISYESHPIVREMKDVATVFPLVRSLEIKNGDKTTVEKLFQTTEDSIATKNLTSGEIRPTKDDAKGPFVLGAAGTYNSGKENGNGRFVVVGGARWAANGGIRLGGNRDLFLNMMNWLTSDEDLISIRPKEPEDRRLNMTARQMSLVFYISIVGLPLIMMLSGVGVWWRRR